MTIVKIITNRLQRAKRRIHNGHKWAAGAVGFLLAITATTVIVTALQANVMTQLQDGSVYGGRSPNPGSMLLYKGSNFWASSFANTDPGISTGSGFKHILKNQDSGKIRKIRFNAYYDTEAQARAAVYQVQRGVCNFDSTKAGSAQARKMIIMLNSDALVGGPHIKFDKWAIPDTEGISAAEANTTTPNNGQRLCPNLQNFEFNVGTGPGPIYDPGADRWFNAIIFFLFGDDVGSATKNQVRFQLRHSSGSGTISLAPTSLPNQFGLIEGGADGEAPAAERYGVAAGIRFGKSCLDNSNASGIVSVYDGDVGKFGVSNIIIFRRDPEVSLNWQRLRGDNGETSFVQGAITWETDKWVVRSTNNATADIRINDFKNTYDYLLVYDNPNDNSTPLAPQGNVISLGVPGESIYGEQFTNCKYNLIPSISPVDDSFSGYYNFGLTGEITPTPVQDTIWGGKTPPWRITRAIFPSSPTRTGTGAGVTRLTNSQWLTARGGSSISERVGESDSLSMPATNRAAASDSGNAPVGSYVCFITSIRAPQFVSASNQDPGSPDYWENQWRHSDMTCSRSVKKPRVQFLGSDLRVGGSAISQTTSYSDGKRYGSWVEYGLFVFNTNSLVGSGNGLRSGSDQPVSEWSKLTFANTNSGTPTGYGGYQPVPSASPLTRFRNLPASPGGYSQGSPAAGVWDVGANPTISTIPDLPNGRSVIIRATGTLTISGDIFVRNTGVTNAAGLSQVVFVADSIVIGEGVTNVDAWLVTANSINTCGNSGALRANMCSQQLNVNGPVYTNQLMLRRTAGGDPVSVDQLKLPAERFNLRPDAQLWAYAYANKADFTQTDFIQELPPRY